MPEVLYISYDGMTDTLGQSQVLPYLVGLSKKGFRFTLISFEKKKNFSIRKNEVETICSCSNIRWIPLSYTKNPPVISTLLDYRKMIRKAGQLHKIHNFKIVHCRSYIAALAGLHLKKKHGIKFIFDMRGFWADERVDGLLWNLKNPVYKIIYRFFKRKEREFLSLSDKVISLTHVAKKDLLQWNIENLDAGKIKVIPCTADFRLFRLITPESKVLARQSLGFSPSDFVISYIGSVGTWYLLDEMVYFFKLLTNNHPHARFLFLTPDAPEKIEKTFSKYDIDLNNVVIKYVERKSLTSFAHASDLNIFFIKPSYSKIASSPTKLGEMLSMGIPVLCNNNIGDVEKIIDDTGAGICIHDFRKETLQRAVDFFLTNKQFAPYEIREKAQNFFDLDRGIHSYSQIYEHLITYTPHNPEPAPKQMIHDLT